MEETPPPSSSPGPNVSSRRLDQGHDKLYRALASSFAVIPILPVPMSPSQAAAHHLPLAHLLLLSIWIILLPIPSEIPRVQLSSSHAQGGRFTRLVLLAHVP
jgi:hypothetical protein